MADESGLITSRNVLAVEGKDEKNFFDKLLQHIGVSGFEIREVGGKTKFKDRLPALLKTRGFFLADRSSFVEYLAVIRDKDEDDAFKSAANIVTSAGLIPPVKHGQFSDGRPRVGIFIMPGVTVEGTMLEDLCLEAVKTHPVMQCVEQFVGCIEHLSDCPTARSSKAKCQVFLAAQNEIVNCVGLGAQKGYWDLESSALLEIKAFLMQMR